VTTILTDIRQGVRESVGVVTSAGMVERDASVDMIDRTTVRAHHCAVGIKKGLSRQRGSADRVAGSPPRPS